MEVTARHPLRESRMLGMPCLKRENGKVVAQSGEWERLVDEAVG